MAKDNNVNKDNLDNIKEGVLDESKKIWEEGRKKIRDEFESKRKKYKSGSYQFQMGSLKDELLTPVDEPYKKARQEIEMTTKEQTDKMTQVKEDMRKEIEMGYGNAIAFMDAMTNEEEAATYDAAARMMVLAPRLTKMAMSKKGRPLTEEFKELTVVTTVGDKQEKVLTEALLDPELKDIALFVLTMMRIEGREDFTRKFIGKHPDKTVWLMEEGNTRGCYNAQQMKTFLELASGQYKDKNAEQKLKTFSVEETRYEQQYMAVLNVKARMDGLIKNDDGNPVLKAFTFENGARAVGYLSSIATIIANLIANREKFMESPGLMAKNTYMLAATGVLTGLVATAGEKKVGDIFTPKAEKDKVARMQGLRRMNDIVSFSSRWSGFLEEGGADLVGLYNAELKKDPTIAGKIPGVKDLLVFCQKKEEKDHTPENKRASRHLAELIRRDPEKAQKDLLVLVDAFETLKVEKQEDFKKVTKEAKEKLS